MPEGFRFEEDLARAGTLPSSWYVEPAALDRERERVFGRTWQLAGLAEELEKAGDFYRRRDYEVACNWKVYVDNYLEGYHIPIVHPGLFREIDYAAYRVDTRAHRSRVHHFHGLLAAAVL